MKKAWWVFGMGFAMMLAWPTASFAQLKGTWIGENIAIPPPPHTKFQETHTFSSEPSNGGQTTVTIVDVPDPYNPPGWQTGGSRTAAGTRIGDILNIQEGTYTQKLRISGDTMSGSVFQAEGAQTTERSKLNLHRVSE